MLLAILGVLDIIAGALLGFSGMFTYAGSFFVMVIGIILLIKGVGSYIAAAAGGFFLDFMGILDIISAIMLVLTSFGFVVFFFPYFGIFMVIKGVYSIVMGLIK